MRTLFSVAFRLLTGKLRQASEYVGAIAKNQTFVRVTKDGSMAAFRDKLNEELRASLEEFIGYADTLL